MAEHGHNFKSIEQKWQKKWENSKIFNANPDKKRKKFFLNAPYPYMNAVPHIGHFYTYMRIEALARYKRLKGYNVLFPQAWHCTGSPIVAAARRIEEGEEKQIQSLKEQGFSDTQIQKFKDPKEWTKIFPKIWEKAFKQIGISYDDRRSFITTELNPYYDKFVRWQFNNLKEKGLIEKGKHPVVWDPKTNMPVGDHDRIEGEGEIPQEFLLIKHKLEDGRFVISATLRQDTILGITNLYVHPDIGYLEIEINNEKWILGEEAVKKLQEQDMKLKIIGKVKGIRLIGKETEEVDGHKVLILPATFLDPKFGTGIVHSVPSDSADDLIALWDLQKDDETIKKYNLNPKKVKSIKPIPVLNTPEYGNIPAETMLKKYGVKSQNERAKLEKIKKELYKLSFHTATFNEKYKNFFSKNLYGMKVSEEKDFIKQELLKMGRIDTYYQLTGKVVSRSLTECIVKIVSDQWFIKYGDKNWKKKAHESLNDLKLYPETAREQFAYTIDWLNDWACTREYGLGTRLPFDEKWLIESLSDSTIYMAYYTISHLIENISIEKVDDKFFDYIFLNKKPKPKIKGIEKLKEEFEYWYPFDIRNSGKDLIQNHLTFCLFNHVAIFPKKYWPKGFGVNGWVRVESQKMSKSLGNMIPLTEMAEKFGADVSRLTILNGGEDLDDPNWDSNFADMVGVRLVNLYEFSVENYNKGRIERNNSDDWMRGELNKILKDTEEFMEKTMFRSAIQRGYFDLQNSLKRYLQKNEKPNKNLMNKIIEGQLLLLSPFVPFITEEIWEKIGKKGFISLAEWPKVDLKKIDKKIEKNEEKINNVQRDIINIKNIVKQDRPYTYIYPIPSEVNLFEENKNFLANTTGSKVISVFSAKDVKETPSLDPQGKAKNAKPGKPGIYVSGTALVV